MLKYLEAIRRDTNAVVFLSAHQTDSAILASDFVLPLRERPLHVAQCDLIPVNLPRPRSVAVRYEPEFEKLLLRIGTMMQGEPNILE